MESSFSFGQRLKEYLLNSIPSARLASGGKMINCRCFECGDSQKSMKSAHLYISMPSQNGPGWFYCHKCNSSGILTHRKLLDWNIYDSDIANDLYIHNSSTLRSFKYGDLGCGKVYSIKNNIIRNDQLSLIKMDYINNRLGTKLTPTDFLNLKVVINLNDIIQQNNITKLTRSYNIVQDLDRAFVGFLSLDNGFVTLRKLDDQIVYDEINLRYVNYKLFDKQDTSERFYVVPQQIDLLQQDRIKIHIAEGVFDILSIYLNLRKGESGIYSTVSGSNYSSIISYFMIEKMIPNLEIHLYPDNDQPQWKMDNIIKKYNPMQVPIFIHRNLSPREKDFGVSIDRIQESVIKANYWI